MFERTKFVNGQSFEVFCAGFSARDTGYVAFGPEAKKFDFFGAMRESVTYASIHGSDQSGLKRNRAFFWSLFCEVKQQLPKRLRRYLRLATTLGTPLDYFYGTDFIFFLGNHYVSVDATLNIFHKKDRKNCFFFTPENIERSNMVQFAKKLALGLVDNNGLDEETLRCIREIMYKGNNSS